MKQRCGVGMGCGKARCAGSAKNASATVRADVLVLVAPTMLQGDPLAAEEAFEFVIARGVAEQVLERRRRVVRRRAVVSDDALVLAHLIARRQLQAGAALRVDGHEVQACRRNLQVDPLLRATVAAVEQRRLPAGFGEECTGPSRSTAAA